MALVRTLAKGLRKTPRQGGGPMDVDGPTVTISGYPADPTDDPTPTFTFSANEAGCTFEYKVNAGSYAACTSPLTLAAQTDGAYTIYIRATDRQGNVGGASTYSWELATAYAGSYPTTVALLNGWSLASPWNVLHNYNDATVNPSACPTAAGSDSLSLMKLGSNNTATITAVGQGGYAAQEGYTVNTNQDSLYAGASATWKFSATVPTCYLVTCKFAGTPTSGTIFFGGSDGSTGGWYLEAHSTSGVRAAIGNGTSGFVGTAYVGGTSFYDGEYHTLMLVVDDANGKAKLFSEFANTESTGLTIGSNNAFITVGPYAAGATWDTAVTYLITARGEHSLLYTNAQSLFDEYEDARLNNVNQAAIAGLPTTLAELNSATGLQFTHGWNLNHATSVAPISGASGVTLAPNTGTIYGGTGTAPTLLSAPQVRTSFTSQAAVELNSTYDNLQGSDLWPSYNFTGLVVINVNYSSNSDIAAKRRSTSGERGFRLHTDGSSVNLWCYSSHPTATSHSTQIPTQWVGGAGYAPITFRVPGAAGEQSRVCPGSRTPSNSGVGYGTPGSESGANPAVGCDTNGAVNTGKVAFTAYLSGQTADATMDAAHSALRWRYGI